MLSRKRIGHYEFVFVILKTLELIVTAHSKRSSLRTFLYFHSPMPHINLRPDFIPMHLQNNLTRLQLFVVILNCVRISDRSQQAQDVNAVLFNMKLITLQSWSIYKVVCDFHVNSNHWFNLSETI